MPNLYPRPVLTCPVAIPQLYPFSTCPNIKPKAQKELVLFYFLEEKSDLNCETVMQNIPTVIAKYRDNVDVIMKPKCSVTKHMVTFLYRL